MLDVIVLIAMAITAAAVAAGLTIQAGMPLLPVVIAAMALFFVMAASFLTLGRSSRSGGGGGRLDEFEEALEIIDSDLQRIDRVEDDIARLDLLSDRVERLDQALADFTPGEAPSDQARLRELANEFENVYARIETLRADVDRLFPDLAAASSAMPATPSPAFGTRARPPAPPVDVEEVEIDIVEEEEAEVPASEPFAAPEPEAEAEAEVEAEAEAEAEAEEVATLSLDEETMPEPEEAPALSSFAIDDDDDDRIRDHVRQAVERGRIDLYLQPTLTLPDRKVRYFEALTRIRTADDDLILPGAYVPVAKRAGLMPLIDNVLLVRSVQALRRLGSDSKVHGLFCNVSMHSLVDPDYFPELVEFMEENSSLSEGLVFEISQPELTGLTEAELGCLDTLGALGYTFCLDQVTDLDADFANLSDRYFRYAKINAATFLHRMEETGHNAADFKRLLDGLGIQLIVEKVEDEGDVAELLDHGVELAQGYLFGEPKPTNEALSRELEGAD
ncbi:MAG: EAL domain-containing protein [Hyphomicrobiales bacterium]